MPSLLLHIRRIMLVSRCVRLDLLRAFGQTDTLAKTKGIYVLQRNHCKALLGANAFDSRFKRSIFWGPSLDLYQGVVDIYLELGLALRASAFYKKWGDLKNSLRQTT